MNYDYLKWLSTTKSKWWHDSADPAEIETSIANGAVGATTNPFLINKTLSDNAEYWREELSFIPKDLKGDEKVKTVLGETVKNLAKYFKDIFIKTEGKQGYVCAQTNPSHAGDIEVMAELAEYYHQLGENICIKLPATKAGLATMEQCVAKGIPVTITASYTVPQAIAIAEHYKKGADILRKEGKQPKPCFSVLMTGRLDDYLRDVAHDNGSSVSEEDIRCAGNAVAKRAYKIYEENGFEPTIMPAGLRGTYHVTELAGAKMVFSVAPKIQKMLSDANPEKAERINIPIDKKIIDRLMTMPEFIKAYEPDGMKEEDFITYGVEQRTLSQFVEAGWSPIGNFKL